MIARRSGTTFPACRSESIGRSRRERRTSKGANMRLSKQPFAMAVLTAAWLLVVPGAHAQNQSAPNQSASPNISDQKLDAAAAAIDRVASVKQNYQQQIAAAPASDKDRLAGDASNAKIGRASCRERV